MYASHFVFFSLRLLLLVDYNEISSFDSNVMRWCSVHNALIRAHVSLEHHIKAGIKNGFCNWKRKVSILYIGIYYVTSSVRIHIIQ